MGALRRPVGRRDGAPHPRDDQHARVEPTTLQTGLEALLKRGENVIAVYAAPEKEGQKADPLTEAARYLRLPPATLRAWTLGRPYPTSTGSGRFLTDGMGVDVAIEAVGIPATFRACCDLVRPGGSVANVGVHGAPVELPLQDLWIQDLSITMGLVSTSTTPMLLKTVQSKKLQPEQLITHRFTFDQFPEAYEVFGSAAREQALKDLEYLARAWHQLDARHSQSVRAGH